MTMETPRTENRVQTHFLPSKQSSKKKSLFGKDDESDLGAITPLRYGSNRTNNKYNSALNNITSFRNLFGHESPDSERSLSPDFAEKYTNNGRYELLAEGHDKENQHGVDEETRFSFHSIPATPNGRLSAEESAQLDESNSNSLSVQMTSDLNLVEKSRPQPLMRTPNVTTRTPAAWPSHVRTLEPSSFRRKQEEMESTNAGTPHSNEPTSERQYTVPRSAVKARTALHFNDLQSISTKSFYSSSFSDNKTKTQQNLIVPSTPAPPVLKHRAKESSPSKTAKSGSTAKTPRKNTSMRKRSKSFSSNAPRLGQRGDVHKIRKPTKKTPPKVADDQAVSDPKPSKRRGRPKASKNKRALPGGTKSCPTTPKASEEKQLQKEDYIKQLERVKAILEKGQRHLQRARPLSMTRSMTDLSKAAQSCGEEADSSSSEDDDSAMEEEDNQESQRKFFRSRSNSRSHRKVYNHSNSISLVVRKGGKRKLVDFPQAPKRQRTDFALEEFDFETEQLEVDDLISRLDKGSGYAEDEEEVEKQCYEQHQPYESTEYEEVIDYVDDEPIPVQSNVIYVTVDDYFVEETQLDGVVYEELMQSSQTIIVRHDDENQTNGQNADFLTDMIVDNAENGMGYEELMQSSQTIIVRHDDENQTNRQNADFLTDMIVDNAENSFSQNNQAQWVAEDRGTVQTTEVTSNSTTQYYPIFYRDQVKELWKQDRSQSSANPAKMDVFHTLRQQDQQSRHKQQRYGTGQDQYQLDAGQRAYGAVQCTECGLTYSNKEPEEELIHNNFHRSQAQLTFAGWANEHIVSLVPEWDVTGRIVVVSQVDNRQWLAKVRSILEVVDSELGFATHGELPEGACVYLAIARSTVLGVCVVQPLQCANRMISIEGLHGAPIDCYSSEFYPAKCGISRIWVSPKYRRLGVGRTLLMAIKQHYIFGYVIRFDEIAFGAPTESGKLFAESVTGRKEFLVYL